MTRCLPFLMLVLVSDPFELAAATPQVLVEDSFTVNGGVRMANSDLGGQAVEKGDVEWKRAGNLVVLPDGFVSASGSAGSVGLVPLNAAGASLCVEADLNPSGSGFVALAFMTKGDLNFWNDAALWMTLWPNGKCELRLGNEVIAEANPLKSFKKDNFNRVILTYDRATGAANLRVNGEVVAESVTLTEKPAVGAVCFRFQEPLKVNGPAIDNFRVTQSGATAEKSAATSAPPPLPPLKTTKPLPELMGSPFWTSEVVTDEPLVFVDRGEGPSANLLFEPAEILSIRSANHEKEYPLADLVSTPGKNTLSLKKESQIPALTLEELYPAAESKGAIKAARGENATKLGGKRWLRFSENVNAYFAKQVLVTYRHKKDWSGYKPEVRSEKLSRSFDKLKNKIPFKLLVIGDSISAGCFASANLKSPPYQPSYPRLIVEGLKMAYGGKVEMVNLSKGGQVANYALSQLAQIKAAKPDLIILAFGMNDGSARIPVDKYAATIHNFADQVRSTLPETDIILVSTILGNPEWTAAAPDLYPGYRDSLKALEQPGVALADMTAMSTDLLKTKSYADITVNGVNHPNDFAHRVYAQLILSLLDANQK